MPAIVAQFFPMRCKRIDRGGWGERLTSVPGQLSPSSCFLRVSGCRGNVSFEPVQLWLKTFDLLLDTFEFLRPPMSVVQDSRPLDRYLIMFDECAHPAKGGLEGREPIRGLFRNIKGLLHDVCNPLSLYWEPPGRQRAERTRGVGSAHIDLGQSWPRSSSEVALDA